jgi:predicted transcriptional regulator
VADNDGERRPAGMQPMGVAEELRLTVGVLGRSLRRVTRRLESIARLGALERAVMAHLWKVGEADVAEIHAALGAKRRISLNTIGSTLERLSRKELASRWKVSHAYRYKASLTEAEFLARQVVQSVGGLRAFKNQGLLASFVDLATEADDANLDALEQLIAERRGAGKL